MKIKKKSYLLLLALCLSILSINSWADTYKYHADVKGMVCAFCAYSVSKNISKLPGVDADSVNVDLQGGKLDFNSTQKVSETDVMALFNESGFTVSNLSFSRISDNPEKQTAEVIFDLKIDVFKTDQFSGVIEAIGNFSARSSSRIIIKAPASQEDTILKPLLMGRQQVVKVQYIPVKSDVIHLQIMESPH